MFSFVQEAPNNFYDVIGMFHVLEHFADPIAELINTRKKLKNNGKLVIEVPHARDALITWYNLEEFKKFTFWSEHLVLHTRESLSAILHHAGFKIQSIEGIQRFPLANHLRWLKEKKPSGHIDWPQFLNSTLDYEYASLLSKLDMNDTLMVIAESY
ncbi:MAG: class I SAM-dependent methyltransferase [Silvanigrellaceae bacterium]|nr:class I SAM-dependent methyltransferase [Silvanigrellaceae bacterium]